MERTLISQDYLRDESRYGPGKAEALVFPSSEAEIAGILALAQRTGTPVTLSGGRTGLVGGAVPDGGTVLSLERMNRFLGLKREPGGGWLLRLQPGVRLDQVQQAVTRKNLPGLSETDLIAFRVDPGGYFYPPDPTESSAQMGGNVATNASGSRSFKYGSTRENIHGLRVVLPTGEVWALKRGEAKVEGAGAIGGDRGRLRDQVALPSYRMPPVKNAAGLFAAPGMDLLDLFVGSEGILGVVTEIELLLVPAPPGFMSGMAFFQDETAALEFVQSARSGNGVDPCGLEYYDFPSLRLLDNWRRSGHGSYPPFPADSKAAVLFEQALETDRTAEREKLLERWEPLLLAHGSSLDHTWAGVDSASGSRLREIRHALPEAVNALVASNKLICPSIHKVATDLAVPDGKLFPMFAAYQEAFREAEVDFVIYGHAGQNHLHTNLMPVNQEELTRAREAAVALARTAVSMGGTVSAEHGIGKIKRHLLPVLYGEEGVRQMRRLKQSLDPAGILNRGVLFEWQER